MKKRALVAAGAALALAATAYAQSADDAVGVWENPENKSHTQFYKCGDGVCAKIIRVVDGQKTDDKNPDAAKRSRPIVGLVIMQSAKKTGPTTWHGQALQPRRRQDLHRHAYGQEQGRGGAVGLRRPWCSARPPRSRA